MPVGIGSFWVGDICCQCLVPFVRCNSRTTHTRRPKATLVCCSVGPGRKGELQWLLLPHEVCRIRPLQSASSYPVCSLAVAGRCPRGKLCTKAHSTLEQTYWGRRFLADGTDYPPLPFFKGPIVLHPPGYHPSPPSSLSAGRPVTTTTLSTTPTVREVSSSPIVTTVTAAPPSSWGSGARASHVVDGTATLLRTGDMRVTDLIVDKLYHGGAGASLSEDELAIMFAQHECTFTSADDFVNRHVELVGYNATGRICLMGDCDTVSGEAAADVNGSKLATTTTTPGLERNRLDTADEHGERLAADIIDIIDDEEGEEKKNENDGGSSGNGSGGDGRGSTRGGNKQVGRVGVRDETNVNEMMMMRSEGPGVFHNGVTGGGVVGGAGDGGGGGVNGTNSGSSMPTPIGRPGNRVASASVVDTALLPHVPSASLVSVSDSRAPMWLNTSSLAHTPTVAPTGTNASGGGMRVPMTVDLVNSFELAQSHFESFGRGEIAVDTVIISDEFVELLLVATPEHVLLCDMLAADGPLWLPIVQRVFARNRVVVHSMSIAQSLRQRFQLHMPSLFAVDVSHRLLRSLAPATTAPSHMRNGDFEHARTSTACWQWPLSPGVHTAVVDNLLILLCARDSAHSSFDNEVNRFAADLSRDE